MEKSFLCKINSLRGWKWNLWVKNGWKRNNLIIGKTKLWKNSMRYTPREKIGLRDPSDDLREKETLSECVGMLLGKPKSIWNGIWQGTGTATKRAFTGSWVAKWKMSAHWKGQDSWCWRIWKHLRYQWLLCLSLYWENPPSGIWGVRHQKSMDPPRLGWGGSGKGTFKQTSHTQSMGPDGMLPQAQRELASVTERPLFDHLGKMEVIRTGTWGLEESKCHPYHQEGSEGGSRKVQVS